MGRPVLLPFASVVLVVSMVGARGPGEGQEPYWNSRPLSYWTQALAMPDPASRAAAAESVAEIAIAHGGSAAAGAVPALLANLGHVDAAVRQAAARALEQIGPPARTAVPTLLETFASDGIPAVRRGAGLALGRIDPSTSEVVAGAVRALGDPDPGVRVSASVILMASGKSASAATDRLTRALNDSDASVRLYAAAAIGRAGEPDRAATLIAAALAAGEPTVRAEAAGLLGELWSGRPQVLAALGAALKDPEPQVRGAAADALGAIGRPARSFIDALWALMRDPDEDVRERVLRAARRIKD